MGEGNGEGPTAQSLMPQEESQATNTDSLVDKDAEHLEKITDFKSYAKVLPLNFHLSSCPRVSWTSPSCLPTPTSFAMHLRYANPSGNYSL
jgi:hypothetical protein